VSYFVVTGVAMLVVLVQIARRFGRKREGLQRILRTGSASPQPAQ
jgi:hypothetical protein